MTDTPPKPKRRRWRWLVVGMLLFVASVASWWNWSRGDARFVGKWEVFIRDTSGRDIPDGEILNHRSSGRSTQWHNGVKQPRQLHWWVEGNDFVIEPDWPTGFAEIQEIARGLIGKMTGKPVTRAQLRFQIDKCSESEISFRSPDDSAPSGRRIVLRRLHE